ncbi:hypothetical protein Acsp06_19990 [Actinomycetospora sp. NBRC 106375]|nr:hypothetical protein Acsp06_19990 [Actinomycetospora sp. NBRC 106375]
MTATVTPMRMRASTDRAGRGDTATTSGERGAIGLGCRHDTVPENAGRDKSPGQRADVPPFDAGTRCAGVIGM